MILQFFTWCSSFSIFRRIFHGMPHFFCRCHDHGEICIKNLPFFGILKKTQKMSILYGKIQPLGCVYDFFLGVHLLAFSVGNVVAYPIFSVVAVITEKFALQICCFLESSKNPKNVDFVRQKSALRLRLRFFSWCSSFSIFRWLCRGIPHFICRCHDHGEICITNLPIFGIFKKPKTR